MKFTKSLRAGLACSALALVAAVLPSAAGAAVTSAQITNLPNPMRAAVDATANADAVVNRLAVSGTTNGGAGDLVKIVARTVDVTDFNALVYRANVAVQADGSFSTHIDTLKWGAAPYRLHVIPQGLNPASVADYTGYPSIYFNVDRFTHFVSNSVLERSQYQLFSSTAQAEFYGIDDCSMSDSALFDSDSATSGPDLWDCVGAGYNYPGNLITPPGGTPRSSFIIDGVPALGPSQADTSKGGAPDMSATYTVDRATSALKIHEVTPLVRCVPSEAMCTYYASTGVSVVRDWDVRGDGQFGKIDTWFQSTDGKDHALDLHFNNYASGTPAWELPGGSWAPYATDAEVATGGWAQGGWAARVKYSAGFADATSNSYLEPYGATALSRVPNRLYFKDSGREMELMYTGTAVANTPGWHLRQAVGIAKGFGSSELRTLGLDWVTGPTIAITSPAANAVVPNGNVTVAGTASDSVGVTSVTVNGVAATMGAGGAWTAAVNAKGASAFTAVARDAAGNETSAVVNITPDTVAPLLKPGKNPAALNLASVARTGQLAYVVTMPEAGTIAATLTVPGATAKALGLTKAKKPKVTTIGTATLKVSKAGKATIIVKLTKAAKVRLAKARFTVKATLALTAKDLYGNTAKPFTKVLTLKYVKPHKR